MNRELEIKGAIYELIEEARREKVRAHDWYNENIKQVIYANPATIVLWQDGTKTVVKVQAGDTFDPLTGFLMAVFKKACGNKSNYNDALKKIVPGYGKE